MIMKKIQSIFITLILLMNGLTVMAEESGNVFVYGFSGEKSKNMGVYLLQSGITPADINVQSVSENLLHAEPVMSDYNGYFECSLPLESSQAGIYVTSEMWSYFGGALQGERIKILPARVTYKEGKIYISGTFDAEEVVNISFADSQINIEALWDMSDFYLSVETVSDEDGFFEAELDIERSDAAGGHIVIKTDDEIYIHTLQVPGEGMAEIYVAKEGNDETGDGSFYSPVATLEKAKELAAKRDKSIPLTVYIREGEYYLDEPVTFNKEDSGTIQAPVKFAAYNNEKVTFSGAKKLNIKDFSKVSDENADMFNPEYISEIICLDLKEQGISEYDYRISGKFSDEMINSAPQFYLNGKAQKMVQWPNSGKGKFQEISDNSDGTSKVKIADYPHDKYNVKSLLYGTFVPSYYRDKWLTVSDVSSDGYFTVSEGGIGTLSEFIILNNPYDLDMPGEWYIDEDEGKLYYYPPEGFDENDTFEIASLNNNLFNIMSASYMEFENLNFRVTAPGNANDVFGNGLYIAFSDNITVKNVKVYDVSSNGICINGNRDIKIDSCSIYNCGKNGIKVLKSGSPEKILPGNVVISNNHISSCASRNEGNWNVALNIDSDNVGVVAEHNILHNQKNNTIRYMGLNNIIRYNEIYNAANDASDAAAIYTGRTLGDFGTIIKYNYIHDIGEKDRNAHSSTGIYLDDGHSGSVVEKNIINMNNKIDGDGIFIHGGSYNTIKNNIIANSRRGGRVHYYCYNEEFSKSVLVELINSLMKRPFKNEYYKVDYPKMSMLYEQLTTEKKFVSSENIFSYNTFMDNVRAEMFYQLEGNTNASPFSQNVEYIYSNGTDAFEYANESYYKKNEMGIKSGLGIQEEISGFSLLSYIEDDKKVKSENLELSWEQAAFADEYRCIIAEDKDFKEIVFDKTTEYTSIKIDSLPKNKTYYWKVIAINNSEFIADEWESREVGTINIKDEIKISDISIDNGVLSYKAESNIEKEYTLIVASKENEVLKNVYLTNRTTSENESITIPFSAEEYEIYIWGEDMSPFMEKVIK